MVLVSIAQVIEALPMLGPDAPIEKVEVEAEVRDMLLELQRIAPTIDLRVPEDINEIYQTAGLTCAARAIAKARVGAKS
jgi:hypothetical protein